MENRGLSLVIKPERLKCGFSVFENRFSGFYEDPITYFQNFPAPIQTPQKRKRKRKRKSHKCHLSPRHYKTVKLLLIFVRMFIEIKILYSLLKWVLLADRRWRIGLFLCSCSLVINKAFFWHTNKLNANIHCFPSFSIAGTTYNSFIFSYRANHKGRKGSGNARNKRTF